MQAGSPDGYNASLVWTGAEVANSLCSGRDSVGGASDCIEGNSSPRKVYYPPQLSHILVGEL